MAVVKKKLFKELREETDIERRERIIMTPPVEKQSWWQSLNPKQRKLISNIAIGLGISIVAAAMIYFGMKVYQKQVAEREKNKSFGGDIHATWANQIYNALNNNGIYLGTDVVSLRKTFREIPSLQDFDKVQKSYRLQFNGASLPDDLRGDLSTTEYDEMMAIKNAKPEKARDASKEATIYDPHGWAVRLNAAFSYRTWGLFWGTDADAVTAVFLEIPTKQAFLDTAQTYQDEFGVSLQDDMAGDLSSSEIDKYMGMIQQKPSH